MTITAKSIVESVQRAGNDYAGDRIPASDIIPHINQAQRIIQILRPDATAAILTHALVAGARQSLPATAATFIGLLANSGGDKRHISKTEMDLLDACTGSWRSDAQSGVIVHFLYEPRSPRTFWVYPPAVAGTEVELEASLYPVDLLPPSGDGKAASTAIGNISLNDEFEQALICLTLHLVMRTDLEGVLNLNLSQGYLMQASSLLGVQLSAVKEVADKA